MSRRLVLAAANPATVLARQPRPSRPGRYPPTCRAIAQEAGKSEQGFSLITTQAASFPLCPAFEAFSQGPYANRGTREPYSMAWRGTGSRRPMRSPARAFVGGRSHEPPRTRQSSKPAQGERGLSRTATSLGSRSGAVRAREHQRARRATGSEATGDHATTSTLPWSLYAISSPHTVEARGSKIGCGSRSTIERHYQDAQTAPHIRSCALFYVIDSYG